jgi:GT2 family glycosyltransferase
MNHALRRAINWGYGWVLLVNNDCRIPANLVPDLLGFATARTRAGIVGCKVLDTTEEEAVLFGAGRMMFELGAHLFWRKSTATGTIRVNFVSFAVALIRVEMLRDVGLLEEKFFMYVEDLDLCYRAAKQGWHLFVDLDVAVRHARSTSLGSRSPGYYYYVTRNTLMFIRDEMGIAQRLVSTMAFLLESTLRFTLFLIRRRRTHAKAVWLGVADFARHYSGRAPFAFHGTAPPQQA